MNITQYAQGHVIILTVYSKMLKNVYRYKRGFLMGGGGGFAYSLHTCLWSVRSWDQLSKKITEQC